MNRIVAAIHAKARTTMSGWAASSPTAAPAPTRSTASTTSSAWNTLARFPDLDAIRRSRLKKATLFEMEPSPELEAVQTEYLRLAATLWAGTEPLAPKPMKDREIFDLLGFD